MEVFTILLGGLGIVLLYVTAANGEWGPFAVVIVLGILFAALKSGVTQSSKAYSNFVDYWADDERRK